MSDPNTTPEVTIAAAIAPELPAQATAEPSAASSATDNLASSELPATPAAEAANPGDAGSAGVAPLGPDASPEAVARALRQRYPALFGREPKPIKLRIQADIQARDPGVFSKAQLSVFFRRWTMSHRYLMALVAAQHRYGLDGQPEGELAEEHRTAAQQELQRRAQLRREREQAEQAKAREHQRAEQAQQRAAQAEQRERERADDAQRRERALLLRAFETSTLTPANFCALKGLKPDALEPLLAQARQEREAYREEQREAPREGQVRHDARRDDWRGNPHEAPRGPRRDMTGNGPRRDEAGNGPRRDEAGNGPRRDEAGRGPRREGAGRGPRRDGAPRSPRPPRPPHTPG